MKNITNKLRNGVNAIKSPLGMARSIAVGACLASLVAPASAELNLKISNGRVVGHSHFNGPWVNVKEKMSASRFLNHATMGSSIDEIDALAARALEIGRIKAYEEWIDNQFTIKRKYSTSQLVNSYMGRLSPWYGTNGCIKGWYRAWENVMHKDQDGLRSKMTYAMSQIWTTSFIYFNGFYRRTFVRGPYYYDRLNDHAFSDYKTLLYYIGKDSFMQSWLTNVKNPAGENPDQNFSRECLQLFSMGVYALDEKGQFIYDEEGNFVENYDEEHIAEFAQALTGFHYRGSSFFGGAEDRFPSGPVAMDNGKHDKTSKKLNGITLPRGQTITRDVNQTYQHIANHPSTAPFISRMLIKRFTNSNPSPKYVGRVVEAWNKQGPYATDIKGDFKAVLKAILLDPEFVNGATYSRIGNVTRVKPADALGSKIKDNTSKYIQIGRFFKPVTDRDSMVAANGTRVGAFGMFADTVFNFYSHDFIPSNGVIGDYVNKFETENPGQTLAIEVPELQIFAETVIPGQEQFRSGIAARFLSKNYTLKDSLPLHSTAQVLDLLDVYLCGGQLPIALKNNIISKWPSMNSKSDFINVLDAVYNSAGFSVTY